MLIDPRKFITGPFRACPKCGKAEFGTLDVGDHHISRRCRECWHTQGERLPPLSKKVVYLDQMILSNIAKTLDPEWGKQRPQQDNYWATAFDALDRAVKLQLIVCPYSRTHERESVVLPHFPVLRRLYEHLAEGIMFEWPTRIHTLQLAHAFRQTLVREQVDYRTIPRGRAVIDGDLTAWAERIRISVNLSMLGPDPDEVRRTRTRSGEAFDAIFARWAREKKSFAEVYEFERRGYVEVIVQLLRDHVVTIQNAATTGVITDAVWNYRLELDIVTALQRVAERAGLPALDAAKAVAEFLWSKDAFDAPLNDINALLMAALARRAAAGQKPPTPGMWNDITTISAYLPYCDAMYLDDQCVELLREGPLNERITYPTRLFSNKTRDDFLEYLTALEHDAGPAHLAKVVEVYGESWLTPYRTILQHEREREAKRKGEDATT